MDQIPPDRLAAPDEAQSRSVPAGCGSTFDRVIRRLEELDLAQAIVARALLSELGKPDDADTDRPLEQTVVVTPSQLQEYQAVHRLSRNAENAELFLQRQFAMLRNVTFWVTAQAAGEDGSPARFDEVTLFNIVEIREWSEDRESTDGNTGDASNIALHWLVRGGLWAGSHLRQGCRIALCRIARASLDSEHESTALFALRLGSFAMAHSCPGLPRPAIQTTVGALLAAVGRLPVEQLRTTAWGRRTAADLSDAAGALCRVRIFGSVETPGLAPDGALGAGAIGDWLDAQVTFTFAENPA